jgi:hypothetical protein
MGVYPGSFNPATIAHLGIAEAAQRACGLDRLDLVVSRSTLGKHDGDLLPIEVRLAILERAAATRPWLRVAATDHQLLADIAQGYDVLVLGADKWAQVVDPDWYGGSIEARDQVVHRLPALAIAPRAPHELPTDHPFTLLELDHEHTEVSATGARAGRRDWVLPEAHEHLTLQQRAHQQRVDQQRVDQHRAHQQRVDQQLAPPEERDTKQPNTKPRDRGGPAQRS